MISFLKPFIAFLAVVCAMRLFQLTILRWLTVRSAQLRPNILCCFFKALEGSWLFLSFIVSVYAASRVAFFEFIWRDKLETGLFILFVVYVAWTIHRLIGYQTDSLIADRKEKRRSVTSLKFFNKICDILLWVVALLVVVSALDYDITVLLAGLGVGGVLFAVASQRVLAEMFSSFAIYSDHVFEEGDFIIVGDFRGNPGHARGRIERIGLRSTHLRAPTGETIVLPNQELSSKIIYNYSKKKETRMSLIFNVSHQTPTERLDQIDDLVGKILAEEELVREGRVNFQEFDNGGLVFEINYELRTADYDEMQSAHQRIGLSLRKRLTEAGIKLSGE